MPYQPGQRVRTTVDQIGRHMPAGSLGTVVHHLDEWSDYGIRLDDDPTGRTHYYGENELAPADDPEAVATA
ncbi:hypothetical protein K4749_01290 [Streptomyces sp. TRM72054]|uniref:hypothetical protein n=1 Tax=Streptomyces sp. TRM72054 TaxID=2870562 RepID=UPI001C8C472C|nr:hypothetical protein [Streptomyces sp. TRM72054]MBX9392265.1 hypothetical protein [Streptomyces sp. TRM72054]